MAMDKHTAPQLPQPPDKYDQKYFNSLVRSIGKYLTVLDSGAAINAGTMSPTALNLPITSASTFVVNGVNNNVKLPKATFIRISNPTADFTITGIQTDIVSSTTNVDKHEVDGRVVVVYNSTAFNMTISNQAAGSTAGNRIITNSGADIVGVGTDAIALVYSITDSRWIVVASTVSAGGGGGGAPTDAQYLTLAANATLTNERVFTPGTNLTAVDAGANSTYTLNGPVFGMQAFALICTSAITSYTYSDTEVTMNSTAVLDVGSNYNTTSRYYQIPTTGKYFFYAGVKGTCTPFTRGHLRMYIKNLVDSSTYDIGIFTLMDTAIWLPTLRTGSVPSTNNCIHTTNGTKTLTIKLLTGDYINPYQNDTIIISGATAFNNLTTGQLNAAHVITSVSTTEFTVLAGGVNNANASSGGGGTGIVVAFSLNLNGAQGSSTSFEAGGNGSRILSFVAGDQLQLWINCDAGDFEIASSTYDQYFGGWRVS